MQDRINTQEHWFFGVGDFEPTDKAYEITRFHKVWFELLKIHPSIRLIHQMGINKARNSAHYNKSLLQVYDDFKMQEVIDSPLMFKDWWCKYGQKLFEKYTEVGRLELITAIPENLSDIDAKKMCRSGLESYVDIHRPNKGTDGFMVFAVPFSGNFKEMQTSFTTIVKAVFSDLERESAANAKLNQYKILPKVQIETMKRLLALLHRAIDLYDIKEKWKIGFDVGIYESGTKGHNYESLPPDIKKTLVEKNSSEMKRAKYLLENAAIGKFPCFEPVQAAPLDFKLLNQLRKVTIDNEIKFIHEQEQFDHKINNYSKKKRSL